MCVICVSEKGKRQPTEAEIRMMFDRNPHGAGYMVAEGDRVRIQKGFMRVGDLLDALRAEQFGDDDVVVYHFRISTQAGVGAKMTQPFPLTDELKYMKELALLCPCGVAHNGIIPLTSDPREREYSDTAMFIAFYLSDMVHNVNDLRDKGVLLDIEDLIKSKMVLLDASGELAYVGAFYRYGDLMCSNLYFLRSFAQERFRLDRVS